MTSYFYYLFRLSSSFILLLSIQAFLPVLGQLGKLPTQANEIVFQDVSEDIYGEQVVIEYASRHITLAKEGFEEFTTLKDRKGNEILEHAVSGRFGYLHVLASEQISERKVKRAIAHAIENLGDIEGIIFDLRFNTASDATLQDWFTFLNEVEFEYAGVVISAASLSIPSDWELLRPWQMSPFQIGEIISTRSVFTENRTSHKEIKDQIILISLRKLRQPHSLKNFGAITSR